MPAASLSKIKLVVKDLKGHLMLKSLPVSLLGTRPACLNRTRKHTTSKTAHAVLGSAGSFLPRWHQIARPLQTSKTGAWFGPSLDWLSGSIWPSLQEGKSRAI